MGGILLIKWAAKRAIECRNVFAHRHKMALSSLQAVPGFLRSHRYTIQNASESAHLIPKFTTGQHGLTSLDKNGQHQPVNLLDKPIHAIPQRLQKASKGVRLSLSLYAKMASHLITWSTISIQARDSLAQPNLSNTKVLPWFRLK